jgi:hypothetical protein
MTSAARATLRPRRSRLRAAVPLVVVEVRLEGRGIRVGSRGVADDLEERAAALLVATARRVTA